MMDFICTMMRILFISCCLLAANCAKPNCTSVTDFDDCPGNIIDFCPENIVCACKNGEPFCKCPNYRGQWGNYWHIGAKCEQLWNTLDLILVATLPGIGLVLIVGVTIQTIHYCKKTKKSTNNQQKQRRLPEVQSQYNSAYAFDMRPQLDQGQNPWNPPLQNVFPRISVAPPPHISGRNYKVMIHEPKDDNTYIYPAYERDGSVGTSQTEANYGNKYSANIHMKPLFSLTSGIPKSSYIQKERQQFVYSGSEAPDKLLRM